MDRLIRTAFFSKDIMKKSRHYHDCHQILLILKGKIQICVNDISYIAEAGNIVIFSRYENHSIHILTDEYERYVLHIDPLAGTHESPIYSLLSNRPAGFNNILDVSDKLNDFKRLFENITNEANSNNMFSQNMLSALANQLIIMIYRRIPEASYFLEEESFEIISLIQRRFENDFAQQYTLEALSKEYNLSASSLSHQFKKITGSSVMGYLLSCRIASAKNYLTKTNLVIGEIVERCGFSDSSNFSRTFKKLNGISPSDFRKKYKLIE